jgi:hypothetical protein
MDRPALDRRVRLLSLYAICSSLTLLVLVVSAFLQPDRQRVQVLDVARINILTPDGKYAVVLSNAERLPGNVIGQRERASGRRGAGLLFYNADGNEAGGLIFDSNWRDSATSAFGQLSLDRFESDQVAVLRYLESSADWEAGLVVAHHARHSLVEWYAARDSLDRLATPAARDSAMQQLRRRFVQEGKWEIPRLFAGQRNKAALLELRDMRGRQRLRAIVDSTGEPRLEFLDQNARVVRVISGSGM